MILKGRAGLAKRPQRFPGAALTLAWVPANPLRRLAPVLIVGGVGLIFLVLGGWMLINQAQGTIRQCQIIAVPYRGNSTIDEQVCDVTWEAGGTTHQAAVKMGRRTAYAPGDTVELRVDGERAVRSPVWAGAATAGQGAVLLLAAFVVHRKTSK